jgi:hypothetical protein
VARGSGLAGGMKGREDGGVRKGLSTRSTAMESLGVMIGLEGGFWVGVVVEKAPAAGLLRSAEKASRVALAMADKATCVWFVWSRGSSRVCWGVTVMSSLLLLVMGLRRWVGKFGRSLSMLLVIQAVIALIVE